MEYMIGAELYRAKIHFPKNQNSDPQYQPYIQIILFS
jgi:hypothetical protein